MNAGRPVFVQGEPDATAEPETTSVATATPDAERRDVDRISNKLRYSDNYSSTPYLTGQAKLYPDSIKVIRETYKSFDVSSPSDMDEFSALCLSHAESGQYRIISDEAPRWNESKGTWLILLRVQERMFKTLTTTTLNPEAP